MSNISLEGNASGTGTFTIAAPNTSSNFTLTLPQASGTIALGTGLTGVTDSASPFETALGSGAGGSSAGVNNTFIGYNAGNAFTTGTNSVAVGYNALDANTTGSNNVAMGSGALGANTTGANNTAVGTSAASKSTTATGITAVGYAALFDNTTGTNNTAVGDTALVSNTTGSNNTAVGFQALEENTTGVDNTAVGYQALDANTTGSYNVAMGSGALGANTTGERNVAVGYFALNSNVTGVRNVAVGMYALQNNTSIHNTAIGYAAGDGITTGDKNVCIGYDVDTSASNSGDQIVIGAQITGQQNSSVTIGSGGGKIYNLYTVNATWTQTSDERLKKNIQDDTLGLSFVNRLRPVKYEWKASNELDQDNPYYAEENRRTTGVTMHGLLAQEVKTALDAEGVTTFAGWDQGPDGIQAVSREMFITPLIKAIQELSAKVEALEAQLATPPATPPAEPNA